MLKGAEAVLREALVRIEFVEQSFWALYLVGERFGKVELIVAVLIVLNLFRNQTVTIDIEPLNKEVIADHLGVASEHFHSKNDRVVVLVVI